MVETHNLYFNEQMIGTVSVEKRGLYYHITCRCRPVNDEMFRIKAFSDRLEVDLGICVPMGAHFGLETSLPIKKLGEGKIAFRVVTQDQATDGIFAPINSGEPFEYIAKLKKARLKYRNGVPGVVIPE